MLSLPELDIKYLKTGLDTDLRSHKQTTFKCMGGERKGEKAKNPTCTTSDISHCYLHSKYILDGSNNLWNTVANFLCCLSSISVYCSCFFLTFV